MSFDFDAWKSNLVNISTHLLFPAENATERNV